jgi:hypothetical protein
MGQQQHDKKLRKVQFTSLEIREYPIQIGDSPASARGVPITIGWEYYVSCQGATIDAYEEHRPERRMQYQLRMESLQRIHILKELAPEEYSQVEIKKVIQQVDHSRLRRRRTIARLQYAPIEEFWETLCRNVLRSTIRRAQYREYRTYLARWRDTYGNIIINNNGDEYENDTTPKSRCNPVERRRERSRITELNTALNKRSIIQDGTVHDSTALPLSHLGKKGCSSKSSTTRLVDMPGNIVSIFGTGRAKTVSEGTSSEDGDASNLDY